MQNSSIDNNIQNFHSNMINNENSIIQKKSADKKFKIFLIAGIAAAIFAAILFTICPPIAIAATVMSLSSIVVALFFKYRSGKFSGDIKDIELKVIKDYSNQSDNEVDNKINENKNNFEQDNVNFDKKKKKFYDEFPKKLNARQEEISAN
jgi:hypothetical protein